MFSFVRPKTAVFLQNRTQRHFFANRTPISRFQDHGCYKVTYKKVAIRSHVEKIGTPYLQMYSSSEVETLHVGIMWWEADAVLFWRSKKLRSRSSLQCQMWKQFVTPCLHKCSRSEVEIVHVGRVWWEAVALLVLKVEGSRSLRHVKLRVRTLWPLCFRVSWMSWIVTIRYKYVI